MVEHVHRQFYVECLKVFGKVDQRRGGAIEVRPGKAGVC